MTDDPPKISDRFDGVDTTYHVLAMVANKPSSAIVEAVWIPDSGVEVTVGTLQLAPNSSSTYEFFWDIPATVPDGTGTFAVRLFQQVSGGFEEVASDEVEAEIDAQGATDPVQAAETVEFTWPSQVGPLGFFKSKGGSWRTVVNGLSSGGSTQDAVRVLYSTTPPGSDDPEFTQCAQGAPGGARPDTSRPFAFTCTLAGETTPLELTYLAALYLEDQNPQGNVQQLAQDSADVHEVEPYLQSPSLMKMTITPDQDGSYVTQRRRNLAKGDFGACIGFTITVTDQLDRPVQGANLDVHLQGPNDQIAFGGIQDGGSAPTSGNYKSPDKGAHSSETARNCDNPEGTDEELFGPAFEDSQGDQNIPGSPDIKHRESANGSGSGVNGGRGTTFGQWRFHLYSQNPGISNIEAWIDEEEMEGGEPVADDDIKEDVETQVSTFAQWYAQNPPTVTIDPAGATAPAGACQTYIVKVRSATAPVPDINVDVHAQGPDNELDFCDVPGVTTARHAPEKGDHQAEDAGEAKDPGDPPQRQHTEGLADAQGNFVVGVRSPVVGDTTLIAWVDGEKEFDDDVQGAASAEPTATATTNWASSTGDVEVSFINPSGYGPGPGSSGTGDQVSAKQDTDTAFHIVTRVDAPTLVSGVQLLVGTGGNLSPIGEASRVGTTDTYELNWNPGALADGTYTLRALVIGTSVVEDRTITLNNNDTPTDPDPNEAPLETVEITEPANGSLTTFSNRAVTIKGVASAGAEGVDLFYTKGPAKDTPSGAAWINCGFVNVTSNKTFSASCTLRNPDQPSQVTGVAALTYDCGPGVCDPTPGAIPARGPGRNESGDAHRIVGLDANPFLDVDPAEVQNDIDTCQKFTLLLQDQTGQPIPDRNVDVHLSGPADHASFCDPEDGSGSTSRRTPDQGGHVNGKDADGSLHLEGETAPNGRFVFGATSDETGDSQLLAWLDLNDNDVQDSDEKTDPATAHWVFPGGCTILGTGGDDRLESDGDDDVVCGLGGNDVLIGNGGDDELRGGPGDDVLTGSDGNDLIKAGSGNDVLKGKAANDNLRGGGGKDKLRGSAGNDNLRGGAGRDRLNGGGDEDHCKGGSGQDRFRNCETPKGAVRFF